MLLLESSQRVVDKVKDLSHGEFEMKDIEAVKKIIGIGGLNTHISMYLLNF